MPRYPFLPRRHGVEALLSRLTGILSANAVWDSSGKLREIHVLAAPDQQPKLVVRNVESALRAALGLDIDRKIVSVAQVAGPPTVESALAVPPADGAASPVFPDSGHARWIHGRDHDGLWKGEAERVGSGKPDRPAGAERDTVPSGGNGRAVLTRFEAARYATDSATCRVELDWQGRRLEGMAEGAATTLGRIQTAARAVFHALAGIPGGPTVTLDAAGQVEAHGHTYVIVCGRTSDLRAPASFTGAAAIRDSPEQAAVLAALQATNSADHDLPV